MSAEARPRCSEDRTVRLREFVFPDDYSEVVALWESAGPGIHAGRSDTPEEIAKKLERDPDLFLVAELADSETNGANKIVGTVLGGFDGRRGMMYHLAVNPECRKRGIAAMLMEELERRLRAKGCIRYHLLVTLDNHDAHQFYENRGWKRLKLYAYGKDLD